MNTIISANDLRQKFFDFFKSKNHTIISSFSLLPENDPTVLFTTAGMQPLVPYLMGQEYPGGNRLADVQKCVRTDDIDEVGDFTHHTFFEMLGNWSLGDYFKNESIAWSFEFLTDKKYLAIDLADLAVTVFAGDGDIPYDEESYNLWQSLGISEQRLVKLSKKDNWWGPAGLTGPCGADTEIFYWSDRTTSAPTVYDPTDNRWVEIWNNVFMQYNKTAEGKYLPLEQKNVDTGMGLERTLAALNGLADNYLTGLFAPIISEIENMSGKSYGSNPSDDKSFRIVADHLRASVMIIGDERGVSPSNTDQGYIVRRLLRRAIRHGKILGIESNSWLSTLVPIVLDIYDGVYSINKEFVLAEISQEETKFAKTLENGLKEFTKLNPENNTLSGVESFNLFQSYGFPLEMTEELAKENGWTLDKDAFDIEMKKHQDLSRTASAGKFKGGLADSGEETVKLHTAAHLLLAALRKVLGDHVSQKGSNITAERLRFDFSYPEKVTPEQITEVETLVNQAIEAKLDISCQEMTLSDAKEKGAQGVFESKYGESVKVYKVGEDNPFSYEICGGPHVENTGILGHFKITKEESSSAGVRRIKAVLE